MSGLVGIGGGVLIVPALIFWFGLPLSFVLVLAAIVVFYVIAAFESHIPHPELSHTQETAVFST